MKRLRQLVHAATLAAVALLAILSVYGAFIGVERAQALFSSPPVVVFWFLFAAILLAGFFGFRNLLARPGLLAMHLGAVLILGGSMWGSTEGHAAAKRLLGIDKIPAGVMLIHQGETTDALLDDEAKQQIGELPFALKLKRFWIEYYPPRERPWGLAVGTLRHQMGQEERPLAWKVGGEVVLPGTDIRVKVLQYLAHARPVKDAEDHVTGAGAAADEDRPAMEVLIQPGQNEERAWLAPEPGASEVEWPLEVPRPTPDAMRRGVVVMAQSLFLQRPKPAVRAYKSDLSVLRDGKEVARETIVVNGPLHYGGYHFFQSSYDAKAQQYTILQVKSDNGLAWVYAGFILTVAGAFWWFWVTPVWRFASRRS